MNKVEENIVGICFFDTDFPPDGKVDKYLPDVITQCVSPIVKVNSGGKEIDQLAPVKPGQNVQIVSFINKENGVQFQVNIPVFTLMFSPKLN